MQEFYALSIQREYTYVCAGQGKQRLRIQLTVAQASSIE